MKKYTFYLLSMLFLFSCSSSNDSTEAANVNQGTQGTASLQGYTLNAIPGSNVQKAYLYNENQSVVEEGDVINGQRSGTWVTYHNTEKRLVASITNYIDGKKNGLFMNINDRNVVTDIGYFLNDAKHGRWARFKNTRREFEENYNNGQLDGRRTEYDLSKGKEDVRETRDYKNGKLHGDFKYYNDGKMTLHITYNNGEKVEQVFPPKK